VFGAIPTTPPDPRFGTYHSDLWLLAGLITFADWVGSNEAWFSADTGLPLDSARRQARLALSQIGWPGATLRSTDFNTAFAEGPGASFFPNALQQAVADAAASPGIMVVEGPMGCGKTEAALHAAQKLISSGCHHGFYFALPTQVTSNRIHRRIERFLRRTLADQASFRLIHGNAWLEDDFDIRINPTPSGGTTEGDNSSDTTRDARSWFASAKQALLAPYGVGTIDQALQAVVAVKHFFVRRFALAGKVIILDEVHSYDVYTGALVVELIRELVQLGCTVIVLSATLTTDRRRELLAAAGVSDSCQQTGYPLLTVGDRAGGSSQVSPQWPSRLTVGIRAGIIREEEAIEELIRRAEAGEQVLWIRNTVVEAQESFRKVAASLREGQVDLGLLHSRYPSRVAPNWKRTGLNDLARTVQRTGLAVSWWPRRWWNRA